MGDLAAYRTEDTVAYFKVTALNGMLVSFHTELPEDAVDTALVPARTLEACGVDMVIRCGGQEENYPGCSLNPAAPDYLLAALEKSTMASMTLHLPEDAGDPLSLLGAGPDAENLRIELSGGLNGTMDSVNAGTFNGADLGPGKRSGIEAFQEITDVSIMAVPGVTDANVPTTPPTQPSTPPGYRSTIPC